MKVFGAVTSVRSAVNLTSCLYCSALAWTSTKYCVSCWSDLEGLIKSSPGFAFRSGLQIHYLWEWRREYILNHGSYALKKLNCDETWLRLAELLAYRADLAEKTNVILIPAPPRKHGQQDHAFRLALGLSKLTGFPVSSALSRGAHGSGQKAKSAKERQEVAFEIDRNAYNFRGLTPVFVDDIVTTGATAQAAKVALLEQSPFTVLSLYCRPFDALV